MSTTTTNYELVKPELTDAADITATNKNWDLIDSKLKNLETSDSTGNTNLNNHLNNKSNPHGVTKNQVGLGNVDNTSDSAKPVSTAQATAIADAKKAGTDAQASLTSHTGNKGNPHSVTKAQVGLGNVDNTSDSEKPVSTAQATAIADAKKAGTDAQTALNTHKNDTTAHITAAERTAWNGKAEGTHTHEAADILGVAASRILGTIQEGNLPVIPVSKGGTGASDAATARANLGAAPAYTYGTEDLTAGTSELETGKLYFVYE